MSIEVWYSIFRTVAVIAAVLSAASVIGSEVTGRVIKRREAAHLEMIQASVNTVSPRHLSEAGKAQLMKDITGKNGKICFVARLMDGESLDYTEEFASVFREAGWDVQPTNKSSLNELPGKFAIGRSDNNISPVVLNLVAEAIDKTDVHFDPIPVEPNSVSIQSTPNTIYIIIGRR